MGGVLMKEIALSQGKVALVDDEDYARVSAFKWCASVGRHTWYALRRIKGTGQPGITQKLHQFLLDRKHVDHINGNGLDCRRSNLRPSTVSQNAFNRGKNKHYNTSGFKGVTIKRAGQQRRKITAYVATIKANRSSTIYLGIYSTADAAARAYDCAARRLHGEFARLNFPEAA